MNGRAEARTQRIGSGLPTQNHADDRLRCGDIRFLHAGYRRESGIIDGGNAVLGRAAGENVAEIDRVLGEIRLAPFPAPRIRRIRGGGHTHSYRCDIKQASGDGKNECGG